MTRDRANLRDGGRGQEGLTFESSADEDGAKPWEMILCLKS